MIKNELKTAGVTLQWRSSLDRTILTISGRGAVVDSPSKVRYNNTMSVTIIDVVLRNQQERYWVLMYASRAVVGQMWTFKTPAPPSGSVMVHVLDKTRPTVLLLAATCSRRHTNQS